MWVLAQLILTTRQPEAQDNQSADYASTDEKRLIFLLAEEVGYMVALLGRNL
jgi:hypothetical protein